MIAISAALPKTKDKSRIYVIDMVRGLAIIGVILFHLVWDLDFAGWISKGIAAHPAWILFGRLLAGTFMFLVGVSLVLAHRDRIKWAPFFKRVGVVALGAFFISVITYASFPNAFVFFGILHAITLASLVCILVIRWPNWIISTLSMIIWILPFIFVLPFFNNRYLAWIGFAESPPLSNDLVPVFPWIGLSLFGIVVARLTVSNGLLVATKSSPPATRMGRFLVFTGQHTLVLYLIHQPILLGVILGLTSLF